LTAADRAAVQRELDRLREAEAAAERAEAAALAKYQAAADRNKQTPADSPDKPETEKAAQDAWTEYGKAAGDEMTAEQERKQIEDAINDPNGLFTVPNVATPAPDTRSTCEDVADFLDQCNSQNWRGSECERFLAGMRKCGDPRRQRTDGESTSCGLPAVSSEEAERAFLIACDAGRKRPVPGEDPCRVVLQNLKVTEYYGAAGFRKPGPGCGDPKSLVEPEACVGTFRIVTFGVPDLQQIANLARTKFGGPLILITVRNPDPAPNPKPGPSPDPVR